MLRTDATPTRVADRQKPDLELLDAYWRAANYLSVGQIYLLDNPLLRESSQAEHVKPRLLGHWGTTPGLNLLRRIFANTIKYVLMGTSSNFGNMASAAGASLFLTFLPMLPSQILLNNLLYDTSQLAIPTDNVDEEQLRRRVPFFRSHSSLPLALAALGAVAVGALLPATPLAHSFGFRPLPIAFFAALAGMVVGYLALIEIGKRIFYVSARNTFPGQPHQRRHRYLRRRIAYFSTVVRPPGRPSSSR